MQQQQQQQLVHGLRLLTPMQIEAVRGSSVKHVAAGRSHGCAWA